MGLVSAFVLLLVLLCLWLLLFPFALTCTLQYPYVSVLVHYYSVLLPGLLGIHHPKMIWVAADPGAPRFDLGRVPGPGAQVWGEEFEAMYTRFEAEGKGRKTVKAQNLQLDLALRVSG